MYQVNFNPQMHFPTEQLNNVAVREHLAYLYM